MYSLFLSPYDNILYTISFHPCLWISEPLCHDTATWYQRSVEWKQVFFLEHFTTFPIFSLSSISCITVWINKDDEVKHIFWKKYARKDKKLITFCFIYVLNSFLFMTLGFDTKRFSHILKKLCAVFTWHCCTCIIFSTSEHIMFLL